MYLPTSTASHNYPYRCVHDHFKLQHPHPSRGHTRTRDNSVIVGVMHSSSPGRVLCNLRIVKLNSRERVSNRFPVIRRSPSIYRLQAQSVQNPSRSSLYLYRIRLPAAVKATEISYWVNTQRIPGIGTQLLHGSRFRPVQLVQLYNVQDPIPLCARSLNSKTART